MVVRFDSYTLPPSLPRLKRPLATLQNGLERGFGTTNAATRYNKRENRLGMASRADRRADVGTQVVAEQWDITWANPRQRGDGRAVVLGVVRASNPSGLIADRRAGGCGTSVLYGFSY